MFGDAARSKREVERQHLLEELKKMLIEEEVAADETLLTRFCSCAAFAEFFIREEGGRFLISPIAHSVRGVIWKKIVPAVEEFARTPEEKFALLAEIFRWEAAQAANLFIAALLRQDNAEPEEVFGTDEITK